MDSKKICTLGLWAATLIAGPFWSSSARAGERFEYFNGVRQMGMGGAATAVVNDETSLLSNPAGLGKLRQSIITVFDPELSGGALNTGIMGSTPFADMQTMQGLLNTTKLQPLKHWHAKAQVLPSLVVPNFGVGIYGKYEYNAEVNEAADTFTVDYFNEYAFILGYAVRLFDGRIKIGFNVKLMNRVMVNESLPATSTGLDWKDYVKEGGGIGSDVGLMLTAPWDFLPTLAVMVHDAGGTSYTSGTGYFYKPDNRRPPFVKPTIDAAIAIFPIHSNRIRSSLTAEMKDVTNVTDAAYLEANPDKTTDVLRRAHAGLEMNIGDIFFIRAGMNQRYYTAGVELAMNYFQFQFATYGEELGPPDGSANREDRRYVAKMAVRF